MASAQRHNYHVTHGPEVGKPAESRIRLALVVLNLVLGLGAIPGGVLLMLNPHGGGPMDFEQAYLDGTIFSSYFLPGLTLASLGVGAVIAAVLHSRNGRGAPYLTGLVGLGLMAFELVEVTIIPFSVLQPLYFGVGMAMVLLAASLTQEARE